MYFACKLFFLFTMPLCTPTASDSQEASGWLHARVSLASDVRLWRFAACLYQKSAIISARQCLARGGPLRDILLLWANSAAVGRRHFSLRAVALGTAKYTQVAFVWAQTYTGTLADWFYRAVPWPIGFTEQYIIYISRRSVLQSSKLLVFLADPFYKAAMAFFRYLTNIWPLKFIRQCSVLV